MIEAAIFSLVVSNTDIVEDAMNRSGYSVENLEIREVPADHMMLKLPGKDREAVAYRTRGGAEVILISKDINPKDRVSLIQHEVAHIITWRMEGIKVAEHGREYRKVCRVTVTERAKYFCK